MAYVSSFPGEPDTFDWIEIHKSCSEHARAAYQTEYGIDYHADPDYATGNERHAFWLAAFDARQAALIINPHQN